MNTPFFISTDFSLFINCPTQYIHNPAQGFFTNRHRYWCSGIIHLKAPRQTISWTERNSSYHTIAQLLLHLKRRINTFCINYQCMKNIRYGFPRKFHIHYSSDNLYYISSTHDYDSSLSKILLTFLVILSTDSNRCCTTDNFRQFLGNGSLTCLVIDQLQLFN